MCTWVSCNIAFLLACGSGQDGHSHSFGAPVLCSTAGAGRVYDSSCVSWCALTACSCSTFQRCIWFSQQLLDCTHVRWRLEPGEPTHAGRPTAGVFGIRLGTCVSSFRSSSCSLCCVVGELCAHLWIGIGWSPLAFFEAKCDATVIDRTHS